jgi:hypothetical protein
MLVRAALRAATLPAARQAFGAGRSSAELATAAARRPAARGDGGAPGGAPLAGPRAVAALALQRLGQSCLELSLALRAAPPRAGLVLSEDDGEPFEGPRLPVP